MKRNAETLGGHNSYCFYIEYLRLVGPNSKVKLRQLSSEAQTSGPLSRVPRNVAHKNSKKNTPAISKDLQNC